MYANVSQGTQWNFLHVSEEDLEAQKGEVSHPRSPGRSRAEPDSNPGPLLLTTDSLGRLPQDEISWYKTLPSTRAPLPWGLQRGSLIVNEPVFSLTSPLAMINTQWPSLAYGDPDQDWPMGVPVACRPWCGFGCSWMKLRGTATAAFYLKESLLSCAETSIIRCHFSEWGHHKCPWSGELGIEVMFKALVVQWLRHCVLMAGGMSLIPGWGTKIPHAAWHVQKREK